MNPSIDVTINKSLHKKKIDELSKSIRKKYLALKLGKSEEDEALEKLFKPVTAPLKEIATTPHRLNEEIGNLEDMDKDEETQTQEENAGSIDEEPPLLIPLKPACLLENSQNEASGDDCCIFSWDDIEDMDKDEETQTQEDAGFIDEEPPFLIPLKPAFIADDFLGSKKPHPDHFFSYKKSRGDLDVDGQVLTDHFRVQHFYFYKYYYIFRARAVYEANLPDNFRRPQCDSSLESFIRAKYEHKKYIAREWVPLPLPKVNWEEEMDEEIEKQKKRKKTIAEKKHLGDFEVPHLPKPSNLNSKSIRATNNEPKTVDKEKSIDLLGLNSGEDSFSNFVSASTSSVDQEVKNDSSLENEEDSFFNQKVFIENKDKVKLDKDSILALYSSSSTNNFNQFANAQISYQSQNYPYSQVNMQSYPTFPQQHYITQSNRSASAQWPSLVDQWNQQGQFSMQNTVHFASNPQISTQNQYSNQIERTNVMQSIPTNQILQLQKSSEGVNLVQPPNPFLSHSDLQQQLSNLSLNGQGATPPLANKTWQ
ncbi:hypothetical protein NQ315_014546 [Exocentrus adspersus]|uniref:Uncharacterized protein n=1 Tax=Exocentrus adspersus TaxID=1586481 RepID=A0AAV8VLY4_9CUCU|nr:hypothetical protein NQ315_014546 [Exocentrus adspersus]